MLVDISNTEKSHLFCISTQTQKQSSSVNHHLQLYIVSLDTGCHVMWLIWILQHAFSPQMLCYTLQSHKCFKHAQLEPFREIKLLIIKWTHNKGTSNKPACQHLTMQQPFKIFLPCRQMSPKKGKSTFTVITVLKLFPQYLCL